ncbi:MAG: tRNA (adenosine(37)-N6)-threonylcarbamoyltransferase complex ATPase subunit type 1 TsaE [Alphaproteobacteria bacterium]|nr:tRNA (adenosine(37)-N6)-threonylcarbamoyltransferase complex ATPase subunit type 1 TsaE [Alphaproteobacteria bacterium]MBQ8678124.1 tRNA (adenosine(37)-N6)-threonylcarbamoyltransferase complex ATPase subunit type 1 TsaE [Alphaproteobacteria bacterium]
MNELKLIFYCNSEEKTSELAKRVAILSRKGDVFALYGTLGMGKSVFARAFVQELCGQTDVPSPTFTLVQMYDAPDFEIYHFDLYRLKSPEEIFELGMEEAVYEGVCLIEWPEKMGGYLPKKTIKINITAQSNGRQIEFIFNNQETYNRFSGIKENQ